MDFPVEALGAAVAARAEVWDSLGLDWQVRPVAANYGKAIVVSEFESATWVGDLMIWVSGEAELDTIRVADDHMVNKHYDLAGLADLDALLDELHALVADGRIPHAAVSSPPSGRPL
ncbi:hypothetical protein [Actinoplanes sp. TFC3]|uniref:hypothetical protein n=1 Tax=Actinoplanes sp. TFC3 TaxID=1710355 RepID=UPI00082B6015|nr:hypothetical protein [Actinoplanes sp. TFC3]